MNYYEAVKQQERAAYLANQTVLRLIVATGLDEEQREERLTGEDCLSDWIIFVMEYSR